MTSVLSGAHLYNYVCTFQNGSETSFKNLLQTRSHTHPLQHKPTTGAATTMQLSRKLDQ